MSTIDVEKQEIKNRLISLGEESLSRYHNSLNLSFAQMLAYIKNLHTTTPLTEEIKCLVDAYQQMAEKFYIQFELSLLEKIEEQREIQQISLKVIEKTNSSGELGTEEVEKAIHLLSAAYQNANSTYKDLVKRFPALMQEALDKLRTEWQRLDIIAVSSQVLGRDEQLLRALEAVVKAAAYSVGIEKDRIVIVPSNAFALYFFSYLDNLAVLTVPIPSVRAPWEWSIFWHELAGYQVRELEKQATIEKLKSKLRQFYDYYKAEEKRPALQFVLEVMTRNRSDQKQEDSKRRNRFGQRYLNDLFSKPRLVLNDFGSLEYQFQQMLKNLKMKNKLQTYDEIKAQGWSVDWFEELFEDSFSVMFIGEPFLDFFQDILSRNPSDDGRHPPLDVRLKVAKELLRLMNSDSAPEPPTTVEESAAQQILKFVSLLSVASHPIEHKAEYEQSDYQNAVRYELPEVVGVEIGASIRAWSDRFLAAKDRVMDAEEEAEQFIQMFSMEDLDFLSIFDKDIKNELTPSYETLLAGKDYEKLMDLSFYKRDFFNGNDVKNVARLVKLPTGVSAWQSVYSTVQSTKIVDSLLTSTGTIRFVISGTEYQTTVTNWDNIFPQGDTYFISP